MKRITEGDTIEGINKRRLKNRTSKLKKVTFGDVNVEFKVIDVEAPKEAGDEVEYVSGEVVPEPCLKEMW